MTQSLQTFIDSVFSTFDDLRSNPRQDRSRQSLQKILTSTADIIDEKGYAGVTTAEVAKRTGLAIGTVYRFYPDRIALLFGVYDYVLRGFLELTIRNLTENQPESWQEAFAIIMDSSAQARRHIPGYQSVHHRILGESGDSERYRDRLTGMGEAIAGELSAIDGSPNTNWEIHVTVAYDLGLSLQRLAFDLSSEGDESLLAESVTLPIRYLEHHLDDSGNEAD